MYISRIQIKNFRNFCALDIFTERNLVVVGQNRCGKSNLLYALRLVLDTGLPDNARQLKMSDFWDERDIAIDPVIQIDIDFSDFSGDPALLALLTDYRIPTDHTVARLSYVYRKKADVTGLPTSEADFEFLIFGGGDETRSLRGDVRRRISLDLMNALRDAESDLSTWRYSPLRPLLEEAVGKIPKADIDSIGIEMQATTAKLGAFPPVAALEAQLRAAIGMLSGPSQDLKAKLGFTSTNPLKLFRSVSLFIDDGKRGIPDASLGSANVALLALKLAEFSWRRAKNERNYTMLMVEEPEAHLHPHLQRKIFQTLLAEPTDEPRALIVTTHSPNIASVASLKSIVLLRTTSEGTKGYSLAKLNVPIEDLEDLQNYIDTTRADMLFARGIIFVEGDAEAALLPVLAQSAGYDLDELGISVCSVGGAHFRPYVKLAKSLAMPFSVITDWDPIVGSAPLGRKRALDLIDDMRSVDGKPPLTPAELATASPDDATFRVQMRSGQIYLNDSTLEVVIAQTPGLSAALLAILEAEKFGKIRSERIAAWKAAPATIIAEQLLAMIADVGKGRLAGRLKTVAGGLGVPEYIHAAIKSVADRV